MPAVKNVIVRDFEVGVLLTGKQGGPKRPGHMLVLEKQDWKDFFPGDGPPMPDCEEAAMYLIGLGARPNDGYSIEVDSIHLYESGHPYRNVITYREVIAEGPTADVATTPYIAFYAEGSSYLTIEGLEFAKIEKLTAEGEVMTAAPAAVV